MSLQTLQSSFLAARGVALTSFFYATKSGSYENVKRISGV